jgi:hypothetical protein
VIWAAFAVSVPLAIRDWGKDSVESHEPLPAYGAAARSIPRGAVVFSAHPWSEGFFLDRTAIRYPVGGRAALERVDAQYRPGYLLLTDVHPMTHDYRDDELRLVDRAEGWTLYQVLHHPAAISTLGGDVTGAGSYTALRGRLPGMVQ